MAGRLLVCLATLCLQAAGQRFEARGDTVYDRKTSLIWQRCSFGQQWSGGRCAGEAKTYSWDAARELDADGWRLPTREELSSLLDPDRQAKKQSPAIDVGFFPDLPGGKNNLPYYWSSTALRTCIDPSRMGCGAYIDFTDGKQVVDMPRHFHLFVRLVRSAPPAAGPPTPATTSTSSDGRFVIAGGEALDRQTGLTWQRCDAGREPTGALGCSGVSRTYTLQDARQLQANGWRLPSRDELMTLVDRRRLQQRRWPLIDTTVFLDLDGNGGAYWTDTVYSGSYGKQVNCIDFALGLPTNCGPYPEHARLVKSRSVPHE